MENNYFLFVGIASLFVGLIDLFHTLAYKGMGIFPDSGSNLATQLWIAARYLQSFSLLAAPVFLGRKLREGLAMALFLLATALLLAAVFSGVFPDCFVEGKGLTPFKKGSEYLVCIMLVGSLFFMWSKARFFNRQIMRLISTAIALFISSELAFTIYTDIYGISNMVGHFLKFAGFFLMYKALIETGLVRPYDLLFRELKQSEEKYRALFENMTNGFALHEIVVDQTGKPIDYVFLEVNSAFEKMTGLLAADILNKRVTKALPGIENDSTDWIGAYGKVALTGKELRLEQYSETLGNWYAVMVYSPMQNHFATVFEEISERKRVEEELRRAKEAAEAATRAKRQFLANMSHELRTPMTGVLGMLDLVLLGNLEAEQRGFIETAHSSARSLVRILNDILDLTKIEVGKLSLEAKQFSVRKCLEAIHSVLLPSARTKRLDLDFTVTDDVPETLVGDRTRLIQILTNLAGNAVKFTEKGRVELRVTLSAGATDGKRGVIFTVIDTGIGIPADKQHLLFRAFSQVDDSHSRSYGGTGLGLAISKELVERMGGVITFMSEEGKGSSFSFTLPLDETEAEQDAIFAAAKTVTS